jgi:pimeloyl-ACP methyl ester carboxylesterase
MNVLHATVLGTGKPVLILHGFLGMGDNWKTLGAEYAQEGFEVHLIDQRNHGKSFKSEDFNYDFLVGDLKRYVVEKKIRPAIVLGHSMGGKTAMKFACTYPELTAKLIVADIAPKYYPPHHEQILAALNKLDLQVITSRGQADLELGKYLRDVGTRQFLLKNLFWEEKGKLAFRFHLKVLSTKMEEIGENISAKDVYNGPTLFLKGDKSNYITTDDALEIKKHFPLATLDTIENAGHWLHAENPEQFFEKSISFMKL